MSNMLLNKKELKILEEFSSDYTKKIYGRGISKRLNMNQKTVSNILNRLEKENILKFSIEGKNKYYFLNRFNPSIMELLKIIEINRKMSFLEKYKKFSGLFKEIENRTSGLCILFGSYSKGTSHEKSDFDIFIIGKISSLDDLEDTYNIKINIVKSDKNKFNKEETFIKEVIKNHIILKGSDEFIDLIW